MEVFVLRARKEEKKLRNNTEDTKKNAEGTEETELTHPGGISGGYSLR
jgi:hypothetical protein